MFSVHEQRTQECKNALLHGHGFVSSHTERDFGNPCQRGCNLRCMGTTECFSASLAKGNNFCDFLFDSLYNTVLLVWGLLL